MEKLEQYSPNRLELLMCVAVLCMWRNPKLFSLCLIYYTGKYTAVKGNSCRVWFMFTYGSFFLVVTKMVRSTKM